MIKMDYELVEAALRGYFVLNENENETSKTKQIKDEIPDGIKQIIGEPPYYFLTPDCETFTIIKQDLRVSFWQLRGISTLQARQLFEKGQLTTEHLKTIVAAGFILGDEQLYSNDFDTIRNYAAQLSYRGKYKSIQIIVSTKQEFVKNILYPYAYYGKCPGWSTKYPQFAKIIGFNLPFDVSRFTEKYTKALGDYKGGFSIRLCDCKRDEFGNYEYSTCTAHPNIRILKLGRHKHMFEFESTPRFKNGKEFTKTHGYFVDAQTLGIAIAPNDKPIHENNVYYGPNTLAAMCRQFGVEAKLNSPDFDKPIDNYYLDYLVQDVNSTYELYYAEMLLYRQWQFKRKEQNVYSSASMAKSMLEILGIPKHYADTWNISNETLGYCMTTFHGARCEVGIRLIPVEGIALDFTSQYVFLNYVMGLQDFWMSEDVREIDATQKAQNILANPNLLESLQNKDYWKNLRIIVRIDSISPDKPARLPVRFKPDNQPQYNETLNYVSFDTPMWFTLADVIASVLLTGNIPHISKAIEFISAGAKRQTNVYPLMSNNNYTIDLKRDDLYKRVIDLRRTLASDETLKNDENIKAICLGLKQIGAAGSYGIQCQIDVEESSKAKYDITLYSLDTIPIQHKTFEKPGDYFAAPIATFITAGGRLLLAIFERLVRDNKLLIGMMDTDGTFVAKPCAELGLASMDSMVFERRVQSIVEYFNRLNCFENTENLLKYEKYNYNVVTGKREPLYFIGISSKRYVLYNRNKNGTFRVRKASAHALGSWSGIEGFNYPVNIPTMPDDITGCPEWAYCLWYDFIRTVETGKHSNGKPFNGTNYHILFNSNSWLDQPAFAQHTFSRAYDMKRFESINIKPFGFITLTPQPKSLSLKKLFPENVLPDTPLYTPFCRTTHDVLEAFKNNQMMRMDTHESIVVTDNYETIRDVMSGYFTHGEFKAKEPYARGIMKRRHIRINSIVVIGKESDEIVDDEAEDTANILGNDFEHRIESFARMGDARVYHRTHKKQRKSRKPNNIDADSIRDIYEMFKQNNLFDIMAASGLSRSIIKEFKDNPGGSYSNHTFKMLQIACELLYPKQHKDIRWLGAMWQWRTRISEYDLKHMFDEFYKSTKDNVYKASMSDIHLMYIGRKKWDMRLVVGLYVLCGLDENDIALMFDDRMRM